MQAPNAKDEEPLTCSEPHLETGQDDNEQNHDALPHSDVTQTEQGKITETQTVTLKFEETSLPDRQSPTKLPSEPISEIKPPMLDKQDENNTPEFPIQPKLQQKVIRARVPSPTVEETLPTKSTEEFELKFHQESLQGWENDTSELDASESCTADEKVDKNDAMGESDIEEQRTVQQTVTVHIVDEQNSSEDKDREKPPNFKSEDTESQLNDAREEVCVHVPETVQPLAISVVGTEGMLCLQNEEVTVKLQDKDNQEWFKLSQLLTDDATGR